MYTIVCKLYTTVSFGERGTIEGGIGVADDGPGSSVSGSDSSLLIF